MASHVGMLSSIESGWVRSSGLTLLWAFVFLLRMSIISKVALNQGMSQHVLVVYRHAIAAALTGPFAFVLERKTRPKMTSSVFAKIMLLALLEPVMDQNLYYTGMKYTTATFATAMCNVLPAFAFVMAWLCRLEKVDLRKLHSQAKVFGTVLTVGGAMFMTMFNGPMLKLPWTSQTSHGNDPTNATNNEVSVKGALMITAGCVCWSSFIILQAITLKSYPAELSLTALMCLMGAVQGTAVALALERCSPSAWSLESGSMLLAALYTIEFSERLSYFGLATSLIIYLTKVLHQDLKTAARSVNYWSGVTTLMPLLGGFVADSYLGHYYTVLTSTLIYLMGLILLTMSWFLPSLKPCDTDSCKDPKQIHTVVFFLGIYLVSIGTGGHKPALESFGADQFDDENPRERKQKMSFFNWWNFGLCSGLLLGVTVIVYVQDHVNWGVADVALTTVMAVSLAIFVAGRPVYRYRKPTGSPLTPMVQVVVAAVRKRGLPYASNPALELYEVAKSDTKGRGRLLCQTKKLQFLDKAAIVEEGNTAENPWRLSTVTKVEELKLILNMIPIWLATLPFGVCIAQSSTFFIKQGVSMDRKIFAGSFEIPPASIFSLAAVGMIVSVTLYEKLLVPILRRVTGNERGINILQRIGIGMFFSIVTMVISALVERKRLEGVRRNAATNSSDQMSVFWLAPQFVIVGFGDGFALVGLQEYFYGQVPDSMRSLGIAFYLSVIGAANFISSWLITAVDRVTEKSGASWFGKDLNSSRLDRFYWLLSAIAAVNLLVYVMLARRYSYKNVQSVAVADCYEGDRGDGDKQESSMA